MYAADEEVIPHAPSLPRHHPPLPCSAFSRFPLQGTRQGIIANLPFLILLSEKGSSEILVLAEYCSGNYFGAKRMRKIVFPPSIRGSQLLNKDERSSRGIDFSPIDFV